MPGGLKVDLAILHYAGPPVVGGVEKTIYHHARLLARAGQRVRVIAGRGQQFDPQVEFIRLEEIDSRHRAVLTLGRELAQGRVTPQFESFRDALQGRLEKLLERVRVGIIHNAVTLHKNLPLTAALHRISGVSGIRLIAWCHDFAWADDLYTPDLHPGYPWDLLRQAWPGVTYVAVSQDRRKTLASLIGLKEQAIRVIPPGIDPIETLKLEPATVELVRRLNLLEADPFLLLPARITRRKNIEFALRVLAALQAQQPQARLVVTGPPGPHNPTNLAYLERLQQLRRDLGLGKRAHFLYELGPSGTPFQVGEGMLSDLYHLADVLFFPSHREGWGIPALEAGFTRLPIFAADIPPLRESSGGQGHYFDPAGDPALVARELSEFIRTDSRCRLKTRVRQRFTWERIITREIRPLLQEVGPASGRETPLEAAS